MTLDDFSRLLRSETEDPLCRAMHLVRRRLTAEKRQHLLLSEDGLNGWGQWNGPPPGGGDGMALVKT